MDDTWQDDNRYDPTRWYWRIAGETRVWSSALGAWLPALPEGSPHTAIASLDGLDEVLRRNGLPSPLVRAEDVIAERARRLALGFDYDFGDGDARGVHRIGTTDADQVGWSEVTQLANALIASGSGAIPIAVVTDTGPVEVTATEWQAILIAAAAARQPIWAASFVLQGMDPIPDDYRDEGWWT